MPAARGEERRRAGDERAGEEWRRSAARGRQRRPARHWHVRRRGLRRRDGTGPGGVALQRGLGREDRRTGERRGDRGAKARHVRGQAHGVDGRHPWLGAHRHLQPFGSRWAFMVECINGKCVANGVDGAEREVISRMQRTDPLANGRGHDARGVLACGRRWRKRWRRICSQSIPTPVTTQTSGTSASGSCVSTRYGYIGGYGRMSSISQADGGRLRPIRWFHRGRFHGALGHMNADHAAAMVLYCKAFSKASGEYRVCVDDRDRSLRFRDVGDDRRGTAARAPRFRPARQHAAGGAHRSDCAARASKSQRGLSVERRRHERSG